MFRCEKLWIGEHVAAQINHVNLEKILRDATPKAIEGVAVDEAAIGDEGLHALVAHPVRGPTEKPPVHVVELGFLRRALLDAGALDALVDAAIFAVLAILAFVLLVGVIGRATDDDRNFPPVLPLDALDVFYRQRPKKVFLITGKFSQSRDIFQCVDKAQVGIFGEFS